MLTLINQYVKRGVPVKIRHSSTATWVDALRPLWEAGVHTGPRAATDHVRAAAAQLPPLIPIDGIKASLPATMYAAARAGYRQPIHVDELCIPSYALGLSGAKRWTFMYDGRDDGTAVVDVQVAAFEEDDIFDLFSSSRRYTTVQQEGELLLYAVWLPHGVHALEDQTRTLHGTFAWDELDSAHRGRAPSSSLPERVATNCARKLRRKAPRDELRRSRRLAESRHMPPAPPLSSGTELLLT